MKKGIVYRSTGSWYTVHSEGIFYDCRIKGKLRLKGIKSTNPVAVGDHVLFEVDRLATEPEGNITQIEERKNYIVRKSVNLSKQTHIIASNIDQVFLIITLNNPPTFPAFVDRFLVTAEAYQISAILLFNKIDSYKDFEQYITGKFVVKKMFNKMFNCDMRCVVGINLKRSFYTFDFKEPISDFENFLMNKCVKLPTAKLNRSTLRDSYETWCSENGKHIPKKGDIDLLCKFLDKHFFKDYFYEGTSSYHGWYGITIKENVLRGTGITSTLCKRVAICKVHKDDQKTILQEWNSQKEASRDLGVKTSTLKYRLDNKSIFNDVYILVKRLYCIRFILIKIEHIFFVICHT